MQEFTETKQKEYRNILAVLGKNTYKLPPETLNKMSNKGVIKREELIEGAFYLGDCRNASLAMWDGEKFWYLRSKFGSSYPESINCLENDDGYDLFIPIAQISIGDQL